MSKNHPYVRAIALTSLPEFIEKLGGNPGELFSQVGLDIKAISKNGAFISWPKTCTLLERCAATLDEPHFGIKWADHLPEDFPNTGPMIFAGAMVPTARKFLKIATSYQKIHSNGISAELIEDTSSRRTHYIHHLHPKSPACRQYMEHIAAVIVRMTNMFMYDVRYFEIHFQHSALTAPSFYEEKFGCPVFFNSDKFRFVGDTKDLDKPINGPLANSWLNGSLSFLDPFVKKYLDRRVKKIKSSNTPITDTIEEILPAIFGTGKSDIDSIARAMGLSTKKMQRLLKTEGSNYSSIRDQTRQNITKRIFRESDIPISVLAQSLDYKSSEAFNTACQRWVGKSPRDYRATLKSDKL